MSDHTRGGDISSEPLQCDVNEYCLRILFDIADSATAVEGSRDDDLIDRLTIAIEEIEELGLCNEEDVRRMHKCMSEMLESTISRERE